MTKLRQLRMFVLYQIPYSIMVLTVCLVIFLLINLLGNIQFGGMDGGALINASWQSHLGYIPYTDYITSLPPGFLIGGKLAFDIFGVRWSSLVVIMSIFALLTFMLQSYLFRKLNYPKFESLLVAFSIQSLSTIPVSFWWYNQITAVTGCLFLTAAFLFIRYPESALNKIIFITTSILLFLMKPNIAGVLFFLTLCFIFIFSRSKLTGIFLICISILSVFFILFQFKINPFQLLMIYRSLGQTNLTSETLIRFLMDNDRWEVIETIYYSSPVLLSITLLVFTHFFALFKYKINLIKLPSFIIFLIGLTSGIIGMTTNNDYNMVDLTLILISSFILINSLPKHSVRMSDGFLFIRTFYFMGICILIFYGIYIGLIRYRVMSTGSDLYYQDRKYKLTVITSSDNFFHNMSASPILITTLTNLERLHSSLEKYHIPKNRYYFGPRVDFAYAMFNIPPPKGLPLWWGEINEARGVPKGKTGLLVNLFINSDIKTVVFLENDYQFIPAEIKAFLRKEFLFCHLGNLDVYLRFGITDSCPENILFSES